MSPRESFKMLFLANCADRGMSGAEAADAAVKAAAFLAKRAEVGVGLGLPVAAGVGSLGYRFLPKPAQDMIGGAMSLGGAAMIGLPLLAGAGVGYLASGAVSPDVDQADVKKQEIIDELRHYARRARERQQAKTLRHF